MGAETRKLFKKAQQQIIFFKYVKKITKTNGFRFFSTLVRPFSLLIPSTWMSAYRLQLGMAPGTKNIATQLKTYIFDIKPAIS